MLSFLRFIGVTNAAVWFGIAFHFTFVVEPGFYAPKMLSILPLSHAGLAAQVVAERYYLCHYICASIALAHLIAEWLYASRPLRRGLFYLALTILGFSLLGGMWLQPKMKQSHLAVHGELSTPEIREQGRKFFSFWRGTSKFMNSLVCLGLVVYVWQVTTSGNAPRYVSAGKLRG